MRYYWTDERHQITYRKRVTHAVRMVYGCSRENGVLCTVARSWLLFLHDESEWNNFDPNIVTSFIQLAPCEVSDHVKFLDLFMHHPLPLFRQAYGFTTKTRNIFASSPFVPEMMKGNNFPNFKVSWITEV